jgi:hypothetical protein
MTEVIEIAKVDDNTFKRKGSEIGCTITKFLLYEALRAIASRMLQRTTQFPYTNLSSIIGAFLGKHPQRLRFHRNDFEY